jgi:hypothetical protein
VERIGTKMMRLKVPHTLNASGHFEVLLPEETRLKGRA